MHGLIFAGFSTFIHARYPDIAPAIWESEPRYDPAEAYSDDDFTRILTHTIERSGDGSREILLEFGRFAAQNTFYELYPGYYEASGSTQQFLLGVEGRIHELVRSTVYDTAPPRLQVNPLGQGVSISYTSERGLCDLLEGLVLGTAGHYEETYAIDQVLCMHRGDPACVFHAAPIG
jgi:predicted hydrocarbon binding protein